jgi:DNA-binding GntR family transcriptional regulator
MRHTSEEHGLQAPPKNQRSSAQNLAARVYQQLKHDIFEFRVLPGERFSEGDLADRLGVSRTPVREALFQLEREGYVRVLFRAGWQVRELDFQRFEDLYDVRIVLESAAVRRLCVQEEPSSAPSALSVLESLRAIWLVPPPERERESRAAAALDEAFHSALVSATGNAEMVRIHTEVTERIRIVRRLDFTEPMRVDATYVEHGRILRAIAQRRLEPALVLLRTHIEQSKSEVRRISMQRLQNARMQHEGHGSN